MRVIDVVAGIIFDSERRHVLVSYRKPEQHQGDLWEFPGGKMESGETQCEALKRELLEELDLTLLQCEHRRSLVHRYPDKHVRLHFWDVTAFGGTARGCEGQLLKWVAVAELAGLHFPEANQPIVDELTNPV